LRQAFVALQSEYGKVNAEHYTVEPCSQIDTSAFSSATTPGGDVFFARSIFTGAIAEDTSASDRMSQAILPGELALELMLQGIIIS
jgi:hypothetical protein